MDERALIENRYILIKAFSYHVDESPTKAANILLSNALDAGYVQPGKTLSGNRLKTWGVQKKAPEWACKSAAKYLIDAGYKSDSDIEMALLEQYRVLRDDE